MAKEVDLAKQYFDLCCKQVLDIIKALRVLVDQGFMAGEEKTKKRIIDTIDFYVKFIEEGQGNEVFAIKNLTKNDKTAIEKYCNDVLGDGFKNNIEEFTLPLLICPEQNLDGNTDPTKAKYFMCLRQRDVSKLTQMLTYFEDNNIQTDNIHLSDVSIVNDKNSLFNPDRNIKKGEIEIPLSQEKIFNNLKDFMLLEGYEFSIAPHDNSISIIYNHDDQESLLNKIYDDKNNMFLWNTNEKEEVNKLKKMVIVDGDKTLNDRDSQKDKLFDNGMSR